MPRTAGQAHTMPAWVTTSRVLMPRVYDNHLIVGSQQLTFRPFHISGLRGWLRQGLWAPRQSRFRTRQVLVGEMIP